MDWQSRLREVRCRDCGSLDFRLTGRPKPETPLVCGRCGAILVTWRRFLALTAEGEAADGRNRSLRLRRRGFRRGP
jgi:hypothetical protein